MWKHELDRVDWATLQHNYGPATDVPGLLRGCADRDPGRALDALEDLDNHLYHQGGWVCPAAVAALPFLLDLASNPGVRHREQLIELIGRIGEVGVEAKPQFVADGWPAVLAVEAPRILALLADDDPAVRREASWAATVGGLRYDAVAPALWRRWRDESDRTTRWDLVLALGALLARHPDAADIRAELHQLLEQDDPQLRLAAVHALAGAEPELPPARVRMLIEAVSHEDVAGWQRSAWYGGGDREAMVHATGRLLQHDPVAATIFSIGVDSRADPARRAATLGQAGGLLAEWRSTVPALLPFVADQLTSTDPAVRYRAAYLLGCLGADATAYADRLAELLDDTAPPVGPGPNGTVGDAALWALARQHDPRCLPGLAARLDGDRDPSGFDIRSSHVGRNWPGFLFSRPGLHETIAPLREHVGELLEPVVSLISTSEDPVLVSLFCGVLADWGAEAEPALPVLLRRLDADDTWRAAAGALGALGPAAVAAEPELRRRAATESRDSVAAWALFRVGGDPEESVAALLRMTEHENVRPDTLMHLADLGPLAVTASARLRALMSSRDDWVRAQAAYALWRVAGDPAETEAVAALTEIVRPLTENSCVPVMRTALRWLATIGAPAGPAVPIARSVLANPRRLAYFGSWRTFTEDEELRATAASLVSRAG